MLSHFFLENGFFVEPFIVASLIQPNFENALNSKIIKALIEYIIYKIATIFSTRMD
jgi:hypothetical protein